MVRKVVVDEYYVTEGGVSKPCDIKKNKYKSKTSMGFYLNHLKQVESFLVLSRLQAKYLNSLPKTKPYSPVCVMLNINFRFVDVQVDKYMGELRQRITNHVHAKEPNREIMFSYLGVKEIHEEDKKKSLTKPKPHHHLILVYDSKSISYTTIKEMFLSDKNDGELLPMIRYYGFDDERNIRIPKLSKEEKEVIDADGNKVTKEITTKAGETKRIDVKAPKTCVYHFIKSLYKPLQHFGGYISKVYTKEQYNDDKSKLIQLPEIGRISLKSNIPQLKKWLKDRGVELPDKLFSKQPRTNAKKVEDTDQSCPF
jgi:hypothetical protein